MSAVEIPTAPRKPGEGVRLFGFTVGYVHMALSFFLEGEPGEVKAPVTAYMIDHPQGLVLFDTGLGKRFVRPAGTRVRATGAEGFADWESLLERGRPDAVLVLTPPRLHLQPHSQPPLPPRARAGIPLRR